MICLLQLIDCNITDLDNKLRGRSPWYMNRIPTLIKSKPTLVRLKQAESIVSKLFQLSFRKKARLFQKNANPDVIKWHAISADGKREITSVECKILAIDVKIIIILQLK